MLRQIFIPFKAFILILVILIFTSCNLNTLIEKKGLKIETKMSKSIFLNPVPDSDKIIFIKISNTSGKDSFDIEYKIIKHLRAKGYKTTNIPKEANFILQANILQTGKYNSDSPNLLSSAPGAVGGGAIGHLLDDGGSDGVILGALSGFAVSSLANYLIDDVTISIIVDLQVSELNFHNTNNKDKKNWIIHKTKVITFANKVNLTYEEVESKLMDQLSSSISGIF